MNQGVKKETELAQLPSQFFPAFKPAAYPILQISTNDPLLEKLRITSSLSAQGAIIMDTDSKIVLFSKNPTVSYLMASTTKIMTALVALEHYKSDDIITIQSANVIPAVVGYQLGEKVRFNDVLYGMLLPSGNDAALAIAQNYPGGESAFIKRMNEKAKELSLHNTHFSDASGLSNGNYTTVLELAQLTSIVLQNPAFANVVRTKEIKTTNFDGTKSYVLTNLNQLLGTYGVTGVKTGFTPDAGGILVTSSKDNGHTIIYVVMNSEDRFADTERLLLTAFGHVRFLNITP